MRKVLLYILLLFPLLSVAAPRYVENITLEWKPIQIDYYSPDSTAYLSFEGAYLQDNLPYYHSTTSLQGEGAYRLEWKNVEWEACTPDESKLLAPYGLADTLAYEVYSTTFRGQVQWHWECLPLITQNGQTYKLLKAHVELIPLLQKRDAQAPTYDYVEQSVLSSGDWFKIAVSQTGIHKITYKQLQEMGIAQPENIRIFGYGGNVLEENFSVPNARVADDLPEVPIFMETGNDKVFNAGDYILFYAQGPVKYGYNQKQRNCTHELNTYSKLGYYFLTTQAGEGKRIALAPEEKAVHSFDLTETLTYQFHESEEVNLLESGREWYGDKLDPSRPSRNFQFSIPYITSHDIKWQIELVSTCRNLSKFNLKINDNSIEVPIMGSTNTHIAGKKGLLFQSFSPNMGGTQNVIIDYSGKDKKSVGYINYIALNAYRKMYLDQSSLTIFYPGDYDDVSAARYCVDNATPFTQVWEITEGNQPHQLPCQLNGNQLSFYAKYNKHRAFIALNTNAKFPSPTLVGKVNNQNLHGLPAAEMIIISPTPYLTQAEQLAEHHRKHDQFKVHVIDVNTIYNEFSSGTPDATAYRWFLKMFYDRAKTTQEYPLYLLFMGISSYDNRGIKLPSTGLLSYQSTESLVSTGSYITDDYFGLLDDKEGGKIEKEEMDIAIGRFPIYNEVDANSCVNKTIQYATQDQLGAWKNEFTFLADDEDNNLHMEQADGLTKDLYKINSSFKANKIYLDSYPIQHNSSGAFYPQAKEDVLLKLKEGTLVFTYVGHGSPNTLTTERTITKTDIQQMHNSNLAVWLTATCDFSRYDNGERSAGVEVLLNSRGGGIALFTTTRVVFAANNNLLAKAVYKYLVPNQNNPTFYPIGEVMRLAKKSLGLDQNKLNFTLLGDPAIQISYPHEQVKTLKINQVEPSEATMSALGLIDVEASIYDHEVPDENFNGLAHITLYDKAEELSTLAGKGNDPFVYKDYTSILYSGNVKVNQGKINFHFMVPKDINYQLGNGRLIYYVWDTNHQMDGHGCENSFQVGGSAPDIDPAEQGPDMRIYLNSPQFENGQKVNSKPVFFAHLYDKNGINTIGAGIGHDLTLKLNNDPNTTVVLNDYYESNLNDYTSGTVRYPFHELAEGKYTLEFKAWNLQNLSNTQTIEFEVKNGLKPEVKVFNIYPNPIHSTATFDIAYDRPDDDVTVEFSIFSLAGEELWKEKGEYISPIGHYQCSFSLDHAGKSLSAGIYLVKVTITTSEDTFNYKTQKIIVLPQ